MLMASEYVVKGGATLRCRKFEPADLPGCIRVLERTFAFKMPPEQIAPASLEAGKRQAPARSRQGLGQFDYDPIRLGAQALWLKHRGQYSSAGFTSTAVELGYHVGESEGGIVAVIGAQRCPPSPCRIEEALHGVPEWQKKAVLASVKGPPQAYIDDLVVAPGYQCRGFGRIMLAATMLRLIADGITDFDAFVPGPAVSVFSLAGFKSDGRTVESVRWGPTSPMSIRVDDRTADMLRSIIASAAGSYPVASCTRRV